MPGGLATALQRHVGGAEYMEQARERFRQAGSARERRTGAATSVLLATSPLLEGPVLRQLERDGLVKRTVYPVVPPRVEYELTPLGTTLHDAIQALVTWTEEHQDEIAAARQEHDVRTAATAAEAAPAETTGAQRLTS